MLAALASPLFLEKHLFLPLIMSCGDLTHVLICARKNGLIQINNLGQTVNSGLLRQA